MIKYMMNHGTKFWGNINLKEFGILDTGLGVFVVFFFEGDVFHLGIVFVFKTDEGIFGVEC